MTVSIANMAQVWMDTSVRSAISMNVSTLGAGSSASSRLLRLGIDGSTNFSIDTSGRHYSPNVPAFYGVISDGGGWRNLGGTPVIIKMNTILTNQGNHYNSSTGYFTCPIAGMYKVQIWALAGNGGQYSTMYVFKNGLNVSYAGMHTNPNGYSLWMQSSIEVMVSCSVNDTLSAFAISGGGFYTSDGYTGMSIMYVG